MRRRREAGQTGNRPVGGEAPCPAASGSGEILALAAGLEPDEQLQRAFGVGARRSRDQQHMQTLARNAKNAGQFCLLTAAAQGTHDRVGHFVPKRCVQTGPRNRSTFVGPGGVSALGRSGGSLCSGLGRQGQTVSKGCDGFEITSHGVILGRETGNVKSSIR